MRLLLLEDHGGVAKYFVEEIMSYNIRAVSTAQSVADAKSLTATQLFDCYVVDLNVSTTGLTTAQRSSSAGGKLSGWLWLRHYLSKKDPNWREKTIIYSEYISTLRAHVDRKSHKGIPLIRKNLGAEGADMVVECIRAIARDAGITL